ncbi:ZnF_C2H2 [Nesidiocoris tenuis]|uniref:ZnF_C2H2 n=1 Tax=Nesidiocoris tenuis TaxID=355587 RepID=A0ABN7B0N4_9HEMI|nr:ZnF_C2H2 [Nesidiocoris tenuis]
MAYGSESEDSSGQTLGPDVAPELLNPSAPADAPKILKKVHKCSVEGCSAAFSRPWKLQAHISVHLGESPFVCDVPDCTKSYNSKQHLSRHKKMSHSSGLANSKVYPCTHEGCNAVLKTNQNLKKHLKRAHCPKVCPSCGERFLKTIQLKYHMQYHTGDFLHKCEDCDLQFARRTEYTRHMRTHLFQFCPRSGCPLVFPTWTAVRKHLKTHGPLYVCYHCGKPSNHKGNFRHHVVTHLPDPPSRPSNLRTYACDLCDQTLQGKQSLRRHMQTIHLNPKVRRAPAKGKDRKPRQDRGIPRKAVALDLLGVSSTTDMSEYLMEAHRQSTAAQEVLLDNSEDCSGVLEEDSMFFD